MIPKTVLNDYYIPGLYTFHAPQAVNAVGKVGYAVSYTVPHTSGCLMVDPNGNSGQ